MNLFYKEPTVCDQEDINQNSVAGAYAFKVNMTRNHVDSPEIMEIYYPILKKKANQKIRTNILKQKIHEQFILNGSQKNFEAKKRL